MSIESLLKTSVSREEPLDGSKGSENSEKVSDFITVQSLTNFAAMTGAISAAWSGLRLLEPVLFGGYWVPFSFAITFGIVSILISSDILKENGVWIRGRIAATLFIALINSLVLFSAVIGANSSINAGNSANINSNIEATGLSEKKESDKTLTD